MLSQQLTPDNFIEMSLAIDKILRVLTTSQKLHKFDLLICRAILSSFLIRMPHQNCDALKFLKSQYLIVHRGSSMLNTLFNDLYKVQKIAEQKNSEMNTKKF